MSRVLLISPGFPAEMALFARALAAVGADVIGLGDQPSADLPPEARAALVHHVHVGLGDAEAVVGAVRELARHVRIDQVECLWEPYVLLAARLREVLGLPGLTIAETIPFRDKERMKQVLDAAGVRTPRHVSATTAAGVREAAERIGFPVIVKPIAGAGSADTYRVDDVAQLGDVLPLLLHVEEVSVEEFVDGEEFTHDTICADGRILFENVGWYRPRPLVGRRHEWISPSTVALRDLDVPYLAGGRAMGREVLAALGFRDGFTHMEWYRTASGEVVFGEIGCRPPGARTVDLMNFATDDDLFLRWAEAVVHGALSGPIARPYNAAHVFKRARGSGHITAVEGLERLWADFGEHIAAVDLLPVGAHRRDWRQTLLSDGMVVVRHPELERTIEMADRVAAELQMYAA